MMEGRDLFAEVPTPDICVDPDADIVVDIDTAAIEAEANIDAEKMCAEIQDMYFDDDFMTKHPTLARRLRQEVQALTILIKMRRSDEAIHDVNIKAIASAPTNASLYRALQGTQSSLIAIQNKIDDKISTISKLLKDQQLELNFADEPPEDDVDNDNDGVKASYRGSKNFIEDMKKGVQ